MGDHVLVQNQRGPKAKHWGLSGTIVECLPHQTYLVKMDGSGRISRRRRNFLRKVIPYDPNNVISKEDPISSDAEAKEKTISEKVTQNIPLRRSDRLRGGGGVQGTSHNSKE